MKPALTCAFLLSAALIAQLANAEDWPQWRGLHRDGRVSGFEAPAEWPQEMTKKWQVAVGDGVATPALVEGKLYVFARQDGNEVLRSLDAATGEEKWQDKYAAAGTSGGDGGFPGPRSSPAVSSGKVVTLGVQGTLSCLECATGKVVWRKDDYKGKFPMFHTSSSPIIVEGLVIAQLGNSRGGGIIAYDIESGDEKWKWTGDGPAYASPTLMTIGATKAIIAPTERKLVAVDATDGKLLWEVNYSQGRYNAASPIVDGQMLIYAGPNRGATAEKIEIKDGKFEASPAWKNDESSVQFNTPVLREGFVYGISNMGSVFCVNAESGKQVWTSTGAAGEAPRAEGERPGGERGPDARPPMGGRPQFGGRGGRGGRGGGGAGYGSVVDAGKVLFSLTPAGKLVVFEPSDKEFKQLASYEVGSKTYAYPIPTTQGIYVKDADHLTLWAVK